MQIIVHCFDSLQGCHLPVLEAQLQALALGKHTALGQAQKLPDSCLCPCTCCVQSVSATIEPCRAGTEGKACPHLALS